MKPLYLDHNSTTPLDPRIAEVLAEGYRAQFANPASQHEAGRVARRKLENARDSLAELLGASTSGTTADRVIFTSGATEANNLAVRGLLAPFAHAAEPGRVIFSAIEHPSVAELAEPLRAEGFDVVEAPVDADGVVRVQALAYLITPETRLVSVMLANNETGVLQPVAEIAALCAEAKLPLHTDASQAVGKIPVDFRGLGVAAMTLTAHKFHGPRGGGALVLRPEWTLHPLLIGGPQQAGLRGGTETVALPVAMAEALRLAVDEMPARAEHMTGLRDRLEQQLCQGAPEAVVVGAAAARLPNTTNIAFCGLDRQALVMALDLAGVACSTGSACASGSSEPSPALLAMGLDPAVIAGSIRLSIGAFTTTEEIDEATARILRVYSDFAGQNKGSQPGRGTRVKPQNSL